MLLYLRYKLIRLGSNNKHVNYSYALKDAVIEQLKCDSGLRESNQAEGVSINTLNYNTICIYIHANVIIGSTNNRKD